jgi:TolB protein
MPKRIIRTIFLITLFIAPAIFIFGYLRFYGPIPNTTVWPENNDQIIFFASPSSLKDGIHFLDLNNNRLTYWEPIESTMRNYSLESWVAQKQQFLFISCTRAEDRLFLTDKNGEFVEDLISVELCDSRFLTISPNAESIAVINKSDFYVRNLEGNIQQSLQEENYTYASPTWSPDGQELIFTRYAPTTGLAIVKIDKDGNNSDVLIQNENIGWLLAWSPDGKMIAFTERMGSLQDSLWVMNADGNNPRKILAPETDWDRVLDLIWTPDGQHIVYVSIKGGLCARTIENTLICSESLYMIDVNTSEVTRLTHQRLDFTQLMGVN